MVRKSLALILVVSCGHAQPGGAPSVAETGVVMPLPEVGASEPLPDEWRRLKAHYQDGASAYFARRYAAAADRYLAAAVPPARRVSGGFGGSIRAARALAYHNAWVCFREAGLKAVGRRRILQVAVGDPALETKIRALLDGAPDWME